MLLAWVIIIFEIQPFYLRLLFGQLSKALVTVSFILVACFEDKWLIMNKEITSDQSPFRTIS